MTEETRAALPALAAFMLELLARSGCAQSDAEILTDNLLWNSCAGRETQGLWRLPALIRRLEAGRIKSPCSPVFSQLRPGLALLDGDNGLGQVVSELATQKAIELARSQGIGAVGVRGSNWNGSGAYYTQLAAAQGLIALCFSNSVPKVAPHGGQLPVFGTNPLAFGAPRAGGESILFDMATAASSGSALQQTLARGERVSENVINEAGAIRPFGGEQAYKGYGLSLLVELLSAVVTGASISHQVASLQQDFSRDAGNGQFFLALDIPALMPLEQYYARLETLIGLIEAAGGETSVPRLPGASRWASLADQRETLRLSSETRSALEALAQAKNLHVPW